LRRWSRTEFDYGRLLPSAARATVALVLAAAAVMASADVVQVKLWPAWSQVLADGLSLPGLSGSFGRHVDSHCPSRWPEIAEDDPSLSRTAVAVAVIRENGQDRPTWRVVYTIDLPDGSSLLAAVRAGCAAGDGFRVAAAVAGVVTFGRFGLGLGDPVVTQAASTSSARIEISGEAFPAPSATVSVDVVPPEVTAIDRTMPLRDWSVKIIGEGYRVASVHGLAPTEQTTNGVGFDVRQGETATIATVDLRTTSSTIAATGKDVSPYVRSALVDVWYALLAALAWILLYGGMRQRKRLLAPAQWSLVRLAGILLAGHVALHAITALSQLESWLIYGDTSRLAQSLLQHELSVPMLGQLIATVVGLGLVLPSYIGRWRADVGVSRARPAWLTMRLLGIAAILIGLVGLVVALLFNPGFDQFLVERDHGGAAPPVIAVLLVLAVALAYLGWTREPPIAMSVIVPLVLTVALLSAAAPLAEPFFFNGPVEDAIRWAPILTLGAAGLFALVRAGVGAMELTADATHRRAGAPSSPRWVVVALLAVCVLGAVPTRGPSGSYGASWWVLSDLAYRVDALVPLVIAVIVVRLILIDMPEPNEKVDEERLARRRLLALVFGLVTFFPPTATVKYIPVTALAGGAILWWFTLLPSPHSAPPPGVTHSLLVRALLRARLAERGAIRGERAAQRKLESGELTPAAVRRQVQALEREVTEARGSAGTFDMSLEEAALGSYRLPRATQQVWRCAVAGFVLGLPWALLGLAGVVRIAQSGGGSYPVLGAIAAGAFVLLRWTAIGCFFGAFFPLIRGRTGLAKGVTMFLTLAVPALLATLALSHRPPSALRTLIYTESQLLAFTLMLGIWSDLAALREADMRASRLFEIYDFRAAVAWGSTVVAAIGASLATIIATGLTSLVVSVVQPSVGSHPPSPAPQPTPSSSPGR